MSELPDLIETLPSLDLRRYRHVSVHAPSSFDEAQEPDVVEWLARAAARGWYVVVHPDSMHDVTCWSRLGEWLLLENMDKRKPVGRTVEELAPLFDRLPAAGMCFDIAHARQVDGSMTEAYRLLRYFASRIRQLHVSEVTTDSRHARMSSLAEADYREVVPLVPTDAAMIIESPVAAAEIDVELDRVRGLFCTAVVR